MAAKPYKRRTYLLRNTSQSKYIFSYFILFVLGLLFFSTLFSFMSMDTTTITYTKDQINVGNTPSMLLVKMLGSGWIIVVAGGALLLVLSTLMTHRVAGPAYHLDKSLSQMLSGKFGFPIVLRKYDELKPLAQKLEALSVKIAAKNSSLLAQKGELEASVHTLNLSDAEKQSLLEKISKLDSGIV